MSFAEIWSYDFMRNALISATILGPTCALLGVFVTLKGMAFFSDALAHSAVTGVALGLLIEEHIGGNLNPMAVLFVFTIALSLVMAKLSRNGVLRPDTVIAFSFAGSVALGVLLISMLGKYRMLDGILFGSIYANDSTSIIFQGLLAVAVASFLAFNMRRLTLMTLNPELAHVQRIPAAWLHYGFTLLVAATVVVSMKMLGALLLSALIVVPAAAGKVVARSFRGLLIVSLACGIVAPWTGVWVSVQHDLPTGPAIVLSGILFLLMAYTWKNLSQALRPHFSINPN